MIVKFLDIISLFKKKQLKSKPCESKSNWIRESASIHSSSTPACISTIYLQTFKMWLHIKQKIVLPHEAKKNWSSYTSRLYKEKDNEDKTLISDCRHLQDMRQYLECQCLKLKCLLFTALSGQTKTNKRELTFMACLRCLLVPYCWVVDGEQKD